MTATDTVGVSLAISQLSKRAHPDASRKHVGTITPYLVIGDLLFQLARVESKQYAESWKRRAEEYDKCLHNRRIVLKQHQSTRFQREWQRLASSCKGNDDVRTLVPSEHREAL
jgi:hypothetical protein